MYLSQSEAKTLADYLPHYTALLKTDDSCVIEAVEMWCIQPSTDIVLDNGCDDEDDIPRHVESIVADFWADSSKEMVELVESTLADQVYGSLWHKNNS